MAGRFDIASILRAAGEEAESGGSVADGRMEAVAASLTPWLTEVGGGDRELEDEATGTYVAVHRGSPPEALRVHEGPNGPSTLTVRRGVPYGDATLAALDEIVAYAAAIAAESSRALDDATQSIGDFLATCEDLGLPAVKEAHSNGEGFSVYFAGDVAARLPVGLRPEVSLYRNGGCPAVAIQDHHGATEANLMYLRLSTSDATVTCGKVDARLVSILERIAPARTP